MTAFTHDFVDPTIPGLSGRDLVGRAVETIQACLPGRSPASAAHREYLIRRDLARLDAGRLRDLGYGV